MGRPWPGFPLGDLISCLLGGAGSGLEGFGHGKKKNFPSMMTLRNLRMEWTEKSNFV
jgi:hypothetical protein